MPNPCPEPERYRDIWNGHSVVQEKDWLLQHLEECAACAETVERLLAGETLVEAVRLHEAPPIPTGSEQVELAIARLCQLRPLTGTSQPAETIAQATPVPSPKSADVTEMGFPFLSPPQRPDELGRLAGYRVLRVLGQGGMGVVFEGEDVRLKRRVALKVMRPELAVKAQARERFLREAQLAAALEHDHVVAIYQVGEEGDVPFLAMPLLPGQSLEERLKRAGRLPLAEVLRIGRETAEGLAAAHAAGLIHRDIKPANIWLETRGEGTTERRREGGTEGQGAGSPSLRPSVSPSRSTSRVKILDFGLARSTADDAGLTQSGVILGTPAYMAPEQARAEKTDHRCDLFSLGCVLYRLSTGELPFKGKDAISTLLAVSSETPPPPLAVNPEVPPALSNLIMKLLAKEAEKRPASARALAHELAAIERGLHAAAAPAPRRFLPRRRWPIVAAAVLLLVSGAYALYQIVIIRDRDGNEVARIKVPKDGSVLIKPDDDGKNGGPEKKGRAIADPVQVPEPPPLAEWLKGRKILTVSLDGKGQFKTIQAALRALRPKQVVQVLDRGPYKEWLHVGGLPQDTGLISEQQTVIEIPGWLTAEGKDVGVGATFGPVDGFRMSGLCFRAPPRETFGVILQWQETSGLVLENCCFARSSQAAKAEFPALVRFDLADQAGAKSQSNTVRHCLFEHGVIGLSGPAPAILFEQNYFKNAGLASTLPRFQKVLIRHNVFDQFSGASTWIDGLEQVHEGLEIGNNTLNRIYFKKAAPPQGVTIHNNLMERGIIVSGDVAKDVLQQAKNKWQLGHNGYILPRWGKVPTDVLDEPSFLSLDSSHADYLRVPANGPHATAGAGGAWPSYIGALLPGPAPKEGDWFTRLRERWRDFASGGRTIAPPLKIPEPPPLAEWLKGRTILTVSQGGKGQFKTIQAALDALQEGQVVKVLDKGPYRERLEFKTIAPDTGLVSEVQAILELPEWKYGWKLQELDGRDVHVGHSFRGVNGFRLSGFDMRFPKGNGKHVERLHARVGGFTLENCCMRTSAQDEWGEVFGLHGRHTDKDIPMAVFVRNCVFEGTFLISSHEVPASIAVIENNYFRGTGTDHHLHIGHSFQKLVIRGNVFAGKSFHDILFDQLKDADTLEVSNNTMSSDRGLTVVMFAPRGAITMRNNLRARPGFIRMLLGAEKGLAEAVRTWNVNHNAYADPPPVSGVPKENVFPRSARDPLATPRFLSKVPQETDYLRIPADSPLAKGGAGGAWPAHVGALPPGPVPKEGDWFTRLRERWDGLKPMKIAAVPPPVSIAEPPPPAEWLKGRTILTVSQDGKGQFKTIQAALNALKPGQAVRVLDRGPYRETIVLQNPPENIGLISDCQTVLEVTDWHKVTYKDGTGAEVADQYGHRLSQVKGFRFAGFELRYGKAGDLSLNLMRWTQPEGLVVEDCLFSRGPALKAGENAVALGVVWNAWRPNVQPNVVRECMFVDKLVYFQAFEKSVPAPLLVEKNYFGGPVWFHGSIRTALLRHNVFDDPETAFRFIEARKLENLQISNNSIAKPSRASFTVGLAKGVSIRNNILHHGLLFTRGAEKELAMVENNWLISHNAYGADTIRGNTLAPRPSDLTARPQFLSTDPKHPDYFRIPADSPLATGGVGGAWPSYVGALPPGPAPKNGDWFTRIRQRWLRAATDTSTPAPPK